MKIEMKIKKNVFVAVSVFIILILMFACSQKSKSTGQQEDDFAFEEVNDLNEEISIPLAIHESDDCDLQTQTTDVQLIEPTIPQQNDLPYENFFDFDGDGVEEILTIREIAVYGTDLSLVHCEIRRVNSYEEIIIWSKEFEITPESVHSFAVHEYEGKAYFIYTRISSSDYGYFREDYFYSMINDAEEIRLLGAVWDEAIYDPHSNAYVKDEQRYFYIDDAAVTEQEYQNELGKFGLELILVNHVFEYNDGYVKEWATSEISFSNHINLSISSNY